MPENLKNYLTFKLKNIIDPNKIFYKETEIMPKPVRIKAIHNNDFDNNNRGIIFDPILEDFVIGAEGQITKWDIENNNIDRSLVIRGLASDSQRAIIHCQENNIEFYTVDTGYIQPSSKKDYHRITKNALQNLGPIVERDTDRLSQLRWKYKKPGGGKNILICPPSEKVMKFYNENLDTWLQITIETIKLLTDRPIEVRAKPNRTERVTTNTIWQAFDNAYCLITYNSIAASEAILYNVPAIALAPNAASVLCNTSLTDINSLYLPTKEEIIKFAAHLSYCQFNKKEIITGYAWKVLNESS